MEVQLYRSVKVNLVFSFGVVCMNQGHGARMDRRSVLAMLGAVPLASCGGGGGAGDGGDGGPVTEPPLVVPGRVEVTRFAVDGGSLTDAAGDYFLVSGNSLPVPPGTTPSSAQVSPDGLTSWRGSGDARPSNLLQLNVPSGVQQRLTVTPQGVVYGFGISPLVGSSEGVLYRWGLDGVREAVTAFSGSGARGCGPWVVSSDWIASDAAAFHTPTATLLRMPGYDDYDAPKVTFRFDSGDFAPARVFMLREGRPSYLTMGQPYVGGAPPVRLYLYDLQRGDWRLMASDPERHQLWPQSDGDRFAWLSTTSLVPLRGSDRLAELHVATLDVPDSRKTLSTKVGAFKLAGGTLAWQEGLTVAPQGNIANPKDSAIHVDDGSVTGLKLAEGRDLELAGAGYGAVVWSAGPAATQAQQAQGSWLWTRSGGIKKIASKSIFAPVIMPGRLYFDEGHTGDQRVIYRMDFQA
ncbi:MAG: hypothetical protein EOP39_19420 [Rubrivivax sp.]|nr:MAG: hypothetical protein EOP39_19420 [Rubrivivax sp.]